VSGRFRAMQVEDGGVPFCIRTCPGPAEVHDKLRKVLWRVGLAAQATGVCGGYLGGGILVPHSKAVLHHTLTVIGEELLPAVGLCSLYKGIDEEVFSTYPWRMVGVVSSWPG